MAKAKKAEKNKAKVGDYQTILRPLITEKGSSIGDGSSGGVAFRVHPDATKLEIKDAIERIFDVEVQAVRTCNYLGKVKRTSRSSGRRPNFKKAYVTLKEGHTIDIVEGL